MSLSSLVVPSWRLFWGLSWPSGERVSSLAWVVGVLSWSLEVEVLSWSLEVEVLSWSLEVEEVEPFCPLVVAEVVVVVVSSP